MTCMKQVLVSVSLVDPGVLRVFPCVGYAYRQTGFCGNATCLNLTLHLPYNCCMTRAHERGVLA